MVRKRILVLVSGMIIVTLACVLPGNLFGTNGTAAPSEEPAPNPLTEFEPITVNSDEPTLITGTIPFTSPFFLNTLGEAFVMLEDQAGFVARDEDYAFPLPSQVIGPIEQSGENTLSFTLVLPSVPQGTLLDVDNDGGGDVGVMIFQIAYWNNTWGGPFLEERDGSGWSSAYTSAITDPDRDYEITGGLLLIWAPDGNQGFPSGFGHDQMLFTADDPTQAVPAGYNMVDLNSEPFRVYKEANPVLELIEGAGEVKDFSNLNYADAFDAMFERVSVEYPFTEDKGIDWDALSETFSPRARQARNAEDFYRVLRDFTYAIPDAHVGLTINSQVFFEEQGGSFGLILAELNDGRVIVTQVLPDTPGAREGIEVGAEILRWGGKPVQQALDDVEPYFGPYSTEHAKRKDKLIFLTRVPPETDVAIQYRNPGGATTDVTLTADIEYDSLFTAYPAFNTDEFDLPIEAKTLPSGIVYIRINTFSDDYALMAEIWGRQIQALIDNEVPGLILDLRVNGGGSGGLAANFAGYFIDEEIEVSQHAYYNHETGVFEYGDEPARLEPGPLYYGGPIAILVSPNCVSACEGFAYWLTLNQRAIIVGHAATAGAYGEVGLGQYTMPGDINMQFPTGRPETPDGDLLIEGQGVPLDITVPVTLESALGQIDAVLDAAVEALLDMIG